MTKAKWVRGFIASALVVGWVSVLDGSNQLARADNADMGLGILKCFHPTADFVRMSLGQQYKDAVGRTAADGRIDFRGGFTAKAYSMEFVVHFRSSNGDDEIRVTPSSDNAPFPPNPSCRLREWTRVN